MRNPPTVALVGGGASGTLSAVHLLSYAHARGVPLSVTMIDRYGRHGMGQAYSTTDPHHLLNACAEKMSAIDGDPGHLLRWAAGQGLGADGSAFLPRAAYGRYLCHVLAEAERRAAPGGRVARMTGTVRALARAPGGGWRVRLAGGGGFDADAVVLATGNPAPAARPELAGAAGYRYVPAPWEPGALIGIDDGSPVLVIGTGLTMVDVAISVTRAHPGTVVYAVSRHGLLPRPHPCDAPPPVAVPLPEGPLRLAGLLRAVRAAVVHNGGDWHGVVDGLRPRVPELWARLSGEDRRRFLALVARYWEVHRHRLPPATAARLDDLLAQGRLRLLRGRVTGADASPAGLTVRVAAGDGPRELDVGWVVNGTGPGSPADRDPLLAGLIAAGEARPDPLGLGLATAASGALLDAAGRPHDRLFTLGPTLRGTLYETTAIPEIRAQAARLARRLVDSVAAAGRADTVFGCRRVPSASVTTTES